MKKTRLKRVKRTGLERRDRKEKGRKTREGRASKLLLGCINFSSTDIFTDLLMKNFHVNYCKIYNLYNYFLILYSFFITINTNYYLFY